MIDSLRMGGAEALLASLVRALAHDGRVVSYVCAVSARDADPELVASIERNAAASELIDGRRLYDPRIPRGLFRAVRRGSVDVVHSHLSIANVNSRMVARVLGRPHVTTIHTPPGPMMEDSRPRALADGWTARLSSILVAPSREVASAYGRYFRVPAERFRVIPNAPAALALEALDRDAVRRELFGVVDGHMVVCIARLQAEKGIDELIDATAALRVRVPDLRVVVAGAGPERERLQAQLEDRGLGDALRLLGHRSDVARLLAGADAFCLPSRHEGLPISLLEAMAAGLPCVATAVGGIPTLIEDGSSGVLVSPRDPAALADALELVLTEPRARKMGLRARQTVERSYSIELAARRHADLYDELGRSARRRS